MERTHELFPPKRLNVGESREGGETEKTDAGMSGIKDIGELIR